MYKFVVLYHVGGTLVGRLARDLIHAAMIYDEIDRNELAVYQVRSI